MAWIVGAWREYFFREANRGIAGRHPARIHPHFSGFGPGSRLRERRIRAALWQGGFSIF